MKRILLSIILSLSTVLCAVAERYTVIVSLDGFRWDYAERWDTPHLDAISATGVKAVMRPSFPSSTFPNHYTLATGLVPDHHGIISNTFYNRSTGLTFSLGNKETKQNPRFWGGEPVWLTAKRQGVRTAVVYWPGSDVAIQGEYPHSYKDYEVKPVLSFAERVAEVERLLSLPEDERPRLVMAYFEEPDHTGHVSGPFTKETGTCVTEMDVLVGQLYNDLKRLPIADSINFIVTADHGMTQMSAERLVNPFDYISKEWVERIAWGYPTMIDAAKGKEQKILDALASAPHVRAYRKSEMPAHLQYGTNVNVGDIVLVADVGWCLGESYRSHPGAHGFDPTNSDMHVIFRASGPDFKEGYCRKGTFQNTNVYALLCHLLHIVPAHNDGTIEVVSDLLR